MIEAASLASHLPRMSSITYRSRPISDIQLNSFPAGLQPAPILKQQPKNDRLLLKSYHFSRQSGQLVLFLPDATPA